MARHISFSQFRSKLQQTQSKLKQAQNRQRQAINKFNQAVNAYNSKVRAHNARLRASRDRLRQELQKLTRASARPQYVSFRTSVEAVQRSYATLEHRENANIYDDRFHLLLDLSEREAANSVGVINALQGEPPENEQEDDFLSGGIDHVLNELSPDISNRWHGALFALDPRNPDAARHFCTSARELLTAILERHARDDDVRAVLPNCDVTEQGRPTRRSKIRFLLHRIGVSDDTLTDFVENDMENVVQLFNVFNDGTHGSSGRFSHAQLQSIRSRVEDAVSFLGNIVSGHAFPAE